VPARRSNDKRINEIILVAIQETQGNSDIYAAYIE
jgi:hypothetical protein